MPYITDISMLYCVRQFVTLLCIFLLLNVFVLISFAMSVLLSLTIYPANTNISEITACIRLYVVVGTEERHSFDAIICHPAVTVPFFYYKGVLCKM